MYSVCNAVGHSLGGWPTASTINPKENNMCKACEDNHEDDGRDFQEEFNQLSEVEKQEFYDYAVGQLSFIIDKAESNGVLFDLITKWPREKQVAFEMAAVIENRILNDDDEED
jgi:hypothetical protein